MAKMALGAERPRLTLTGVWPPPVTLAEVHWGMVQFMTLQAVGLVLVFVFPGLALWLPRVIFGG